MRSFLALLSLFTLLASCKEDDHKNLVINGTVDGLKVGNVLLQKVQDSVLINVDSVALDGSNQFSLQADIDEPQMMYLHLDVKDGSMYDDRILFFAEDTIMTINSSLRNFEKDAVITGSRNQDLLTVFDQNTKKLDVQYTDLMKRSLTLSRQEDPAAVDVEQLNTDYDKYLRKRILYALSYASLHKDKQVAPYILLREGFDANPVLLDSVFNLMPKKIQTSLYGKDLSELIEKIKEN